MKRLWCVLLLGCASLPAAARMLGSLSFAPCEISGGHGIAQAECARLEVAENPQQPQGRRIQLAVTLLAARSATPKPDLVSLLAGGPGQSAVDAYFNVQPVLEALRSERHLLLLDQRGTGGSNRLACAAPDWNRPQPADAAALQALARACLKTYTGRADPRWYTTTEAVGDLETLRQALGGVPFNLIGGSYGTRVALEYLRRHPQGVRSLLLDGAVPPRLALLQDHAINLESALQKLSARCVAEPACKARYRDPLGSMHALMNRLKARPLTVSYRHPRSHAPRQETLTAPLLQAFIRLFSYSPEALSVLPLMVSEAAAGRAGALMGQIELLADKLGDQLAHGMELSVSCTEDEPYLRPREGDAATLLGKDLPALLRAQCAVWPRGRMPADFKQPVTSDKPVLILSGELDPVTPPRYGDEVLKDLSRGRHLVVKGAGHIAMSRGCMPRLVRQYLSEADPAALDASCLEVLAPTPLFLGYEGPAP